MWPNLQFPADSVTFTEEILNGKLHFLCSEIQVRETSLMSLNRVEIIGLHIDGRLIFDYHFSQLCKKKQVKKYTP